MNDVNTPNPNKYYSATAIINGGFLGDWVKSISGLIEILKTERGAEVFKPIRKQNKEYVTYKVKGQTLLDIMKLIDKGELSL